MSYTSNERMSEREKTVKITAKFKKIMENNSISRDTMHTTEFSENSLANSVDLEIRPFILNLETAITANGDVIKGTLQEIQTQNETKTLVFSTHSNKSNDIHDCQGSESGHNLNIRGFKNEEKRDIHHQYRGTVNSSHSNAISTPIKRQKPLQNSKPPNQFVKIGEEKMVNLQTLAQEFIFLVFE